METKAAKTDGDGEAGRAGEGDGEHEGHEGQAQDMQKGGLGENRRGESKGPERRYGPRSGVQGRREEGPLVPGE